MKQFDAVVVMGVSGAGKSSVGRALAERWGTQFVEGDDLHPPANVEKMRAGRPLDDLDRQPWLVAIAQVISSYQGRQRPVVIACSALRRRYRDHLRAAGVVCFVFLDVDRVDARARTHRRTHHFMPPELVDSQISALERPGGDEPDVVTVVSQSHLAATVAAVENALVR